MEDAYTDLSQLSERKLDQQKKSLISHLGSGSDVATAVVLDVANATQVFKEGHSDLEGDAFEAGVASTVFDGLRQLPTEVLVEPGFWRYVSLRHFADFIFWRHSEKRSKKSVPGGDVVNWGLEDSKLSRCMPLRIYLRGFVSNKNMQRGGHELASMGDVDKWASHVLSQSFACHVEMIEAQFAGMEELALQGAPKLDEHLRKLPKRLRVLSSDFVFPILGREECTMIVEREVQELGKELG